MTSRAPVSDRRSTPAIDQLLLRLRKRLALAVWLHGLGRTVAVTVLWLAFVYAIDRTLHVPSAVRILHFLVLLALPVVVLRRELLAKLRRVPGPDGLATLVERAHPELRELLVSAVQLERAGTSPGESRELVERVIAEAEERAGRLGLDQVLDPRPPRNASAAGAALALALAALLIADRESAGVFFARIAGGSTPWPQRTRLQVEIPLAGGRARVEDRGEEILVVVARGSDVPVVVRAEGVVPGEVFMHFSSGHRSTVPATGDATFRTLLRSVQEDLGFYVTGGDDDDALPRVTIQVLQPPDVAGIALAIAPPRYSGLPERIEHDRDVEVLAGSRLLVHVLTEPPTATGIARLLPEDRVVALAPTPYPPRPDAQEGPQGAPQRGLSFELIAEQDLRFRFELEDVTGLSNPDPGLFAVRVVPDRPPEVELLAPGRGEVETVAGGALSLRVRAFDDFGISGLELATAVAGAEEERSAVRALEHRAVAPPERQGAGLRVASFAALRIDTDELGEGPPIDGQVFTLSVAARDNREPEMQTSSSLPVRVRVVSADEFLRRMQDRLSRARTDVSALGELLQERHRRTQELVASLESDQPGALAGAAEIGIVLTGQRRVQGDARALSRELAAVAESFLYSRLDERAGALLDELDGRLAEVEDRSFRPELWSELARLENDGVLGQAVFASRMVAIVALALDISEKDAGAATEAIRRAQETTDLVAAHEALVEAAEHQLLAQARTDQLLELLAEWDNFQSVLSLARDILNQQKNLLERTRQYAREN